MYPAAHHVIYVCWTDSLAISKICLQNLRDGRTSEAVGLADFIFLKI